VVCRVETTLALHIGYVPEDPARFGFENTGGQLRMYMQRVPIEIQTATQWHIIKSSTTAPRGVLSPSSILPPFSSLVLNPARVFQKYYFSISLLFRKFT